MCQRATEYLYRLDTTCLEFDSLGGIAGEVFGGFDTSEYQARLNNESPPSAYKRVSGTRLRQRLRKLHNMLHRVPEHCANKEGATPLSSACEHKNTFTNTRPKLRNVLAKYCKAATWQRIATPRGMEGDTMIARRRPKSSTSVNSWQVSKYLSNSALGLPAGLPQFAATNACDKPLSTFTSPFTGFGSGKSSVTFWIKAKTWKKSVQNLVPIFFCSPRSLAWAAAMYSMHDCPSSVLLALHTASGMCTNLFCKARSARWFRSRRSCCERARFAPDL